MYRIHQGEGQTERKSLFRWVNRILNDPLDTSRLLLATRGGILLFDKKSGKVVKDYDENSNHLYRCEALYLQSDSILWTGEWDTGLKQLNLITGKWKVFNPTISPKLNILSISPRGNDELWLGTVGNGIGIFNILNESFTFYHHEPDEPASLIANWVQSDFYIDKENKIWVPTNQGISISDSSFRSFTYYKIPGEKISANAFFRDTESQRFYIGGINTDGLYLWHETGQNWQVIPDEENFIKQLIINEIIKDKAGKIWATTNHGLYHLNENKGLLIQYKDRSGNPLPMIDTMLFGLLEDRLGNLWVGSRFDGVFRINPSRDSVIHYFHIPGTDNSLPSSKDFLVIHEDRQGRIWFGHYYGVTVFNPLDGMFRNDINDSLVRQGIRKGVIWGIGEDTLGRIYLSIEKEGLLRISPGENDSLDFKLFHLSHGLSDLNLFDIARDPDGNLWIINEGVTCFNPYNETFRVYDTRNGLHGNKTWGDNLYIDEAGNLFLSASAGYETCQINNLQIIYGITHLHFEPLEINGSLQQKGIKAGFSKTVRLEAGQENLVFHYKAICFQDPDQVKYAYKLDGYDLDWTLAGNNTEARYTNLPPGKYNFLVKASHRGEWYPKEIKMDVVVLPHFWQTSWFLILCMLIAIILLTGFYYIRVDQVRKKERIMAEFQKKLAESEMQALRAQMNPHFIFNSLNSINNFILKNETEAASDFLTKFSRLVRQVLNNSKNKLVSLEDELTALTLYLELEQLRFANKFYFKIIKDRRIDAESVMVPPLLIQPYVENAIWHGLMHKDGQGNINIEIKLDGEQIKLIVEDDGIGREKAAETKSKFGFKKQSMGMKLTKDRIDLLNEMYNIQTEQKINDLYHPDGSAAGTQVEISIPLINHKPETP